MYNVGNLKIERGVFLAPMENVSESPFRQICREFGADLVFTEFVSSEALRRSVPKSEIKIMFTDAERPIGIQIFGNNSESLVAAARIAEEYQPELIDLNWGCPVKKVAYKGGGSGALKDIHNLVTMTEAVVKAVKLPVTVKTRLGWDNQNIAIIELSKRLQDIGIQALTVHGRTRNQMFKGEADWSWIGRVKEAAKIPVIGNGDIKSVDDVTRAFTTYGVDAVMIGRGAIGNPWIFREVKHFMKTGEYLPVPSLTEKIELLIRQLNMSIAHKGNERTAILEMRRQFSAYFKGISGAAKLREDLMKFDKKEQIIERLEALKS